VILVPYLPHKCLKCGNTKITYGDVLHFSDHESIFELIDVPVNQLHEHDAGEKNIWDDLKQVPLYLLAITLLLISPLLIMIYIPTYLIIEYIQDRKRSSGIK
jgi:hypothetical protein